MKKTHLPMMALFFWLMAITVSFAQSPVGLWKTIDEESGEAKSVIELYKKDGKLFGKIHKVLAPDGKSKVCEKCPGEDHLKPYEGLVIVKDLSAEKNSNTYEGGTIMDPQKGKEYKCKMWIDPDQPDVLNVRGYIAFLYRTQQWQRVDQ